MGLPRYWVNTAALSLVVEDTDFAYSGLGPPIAMTRTYNSNDTRQYGRFGTLGLRSGMFGRGWSFAYNSWVTTINPYKGNQAFVYTGAGNFTGFMMPNQFCTGTPGEPDLYATPYYPAGNRDKLTLSCNGAGNPSTLIYEQKKDFTRYEYARAPCGLNFPTCDWALSSVTDKNGNKVEISRNTDGTINAITDAAGRVTSFAYNAASGMDKRCTSITYPNGLSSYYYYDAAGNLVRTKDLMENETLYTYNTSGYMTGMSVGGKNTSFAYDASVAPARISTVTNAMGKTQSYLKQYFNAQGNAVTDMAGNVSYFAADDEGLMTRTTDPLGYIAQKSYTNGLLTSYIDSMGESWARGYDARGNLTSSTNPAAGTTQYAYADNDDMISMTDPSNKNWQYEHDANHNLTRIIRPSGNSTRFTYTNGLLSSITDAGNNTRSFAYDSYGNIISSTDPLGRTTTMTYDAFGLNMLSETDPLGNTKSFSYDNNRRLTGITNADGSHRTLVYDCCSLTGITDENSNTTMIERNPLLKPLSVTDALGNATRYSYDLSNTLVGTSTPDGAATLVTPDKLYRPSTVTDPLGFSRTLTYNGNWLLTSLADERGKVTTVEYMNLKPIKNIDPLGNTLMFFYSAGRPSIWINARQDDGMYFNYTPDGQLMSLVATNGNIPVASFNYDSRGNLQQFQDASGTTVYAYDALNRVAGVTYPDSKTAGAAYNSVGLFSSVTYPGGVVAAYTYDNRNRVSSVSWGGNAITFSYDPAGNLLQETRSNGTGTGYAYDKRNLVTSIVHQKGVTPFAQMSYIRNAAGHVVQENNTLLALPAANTSAVAAYNDVNQISTWGADSYAYDADGNLTGISVGRAVNAVYDRQNRLTSLTRGGITTAYTYDGLGRRTKAVTGAQTVNYYHDAAGRLLFQSDGVGQVTAYYIYAGGRLVATGTPAGGYFFYHYDKTGNTIAVTNGSGDPAATYTYTPFGEITAKTGTFISPFTYVGAYGVMDEGSGFYFMKNRYYDAVTGKFIQKDPIGFKGGTNLYTYTGNNPIDYIDPKGLRGVGSGYTITYDGQVKPVLRDISGTSKFEDSVYELCFEKGTRKAADWIMKNNYFSRFSGFFTSGNRENTGYAEATEDRWLEQEFLEDPFGGVVTAVERTFDAADMDILDFEGADADMFYS